MHAYTYNVHVCVCVCVYKKGRGGNHLQNPPKKEREIYLQNISMKIYHVVRFIQTCAVRLFRKLYLSKVFGRKSTQ